MPCTKLEFLHSVIKHYTVMHYTSLHCSALACTGLHQRTRESARKFKEGMGGSSSLPPPLANRRLLVFYSLCREYKRAVFQVLGWPAGNTGGGQEGSTGERPGGKYKKWPGGKYRRWPGGKYRRLARGEVQCTPSPGS